MPNILGLPTIYSHLQGHPIVDVSSDKIREPRGAMKDELTASQNDKLPLPRKLTYPRDRGTILKRK